MVMVVVGRTAATVLEAPHHGADEQPHRHDSHDDEEHGEEVVQRRSVNVHALDDAQANHCSGQVQLMQLQSCSSVHASWLYKRTRDSLLRFGVFREDEDGCTAAAVCLPWSFWNVVASLDND